MPRQWLERLFTPPVLESEEHSRQAELAFLVAWLMAVAPSIYALLRLFSARGSLPVAVFLPPFGVSALGFSMTILIRRGRVKLASGMLTLSAWLALAVMSWNLGGIRDASYAGLTMVVILAGLLLGTPAGLVVMGANLILGWGLAQAEVEGMLPPESDKPLEVLASYVVISVLVLGMVSAASRGFKRLLSQVQQNERSLRARNWELQRMRDSLETRVVERTADLEQRSRYLEAAAAVAYAAGEMLDPERLMSASVEMIRDAFGLYYVGLFVVERAGGDDGEWAVLRAGTGEAGRQMLAREHRIRVGEGMIGWCVAHAQSRFAQEAEEDGVRLISPELPETRAEAALPLRTRGRVLGALSVQSTQSGFFDPTTVTVLQTMADLLAIALHNAALIEESERAVAAVRRAYGQVSAQAWEMLLQARGAWGYSYSDGVVRPVRTGHDGSGWSPETLEATQMRQPVIRRSGGESAVAIPLRLGDTVIGAITFGRDASAGDWDADDLTTLNTVADQLSQALDSARLLQESRSHAAREQQINDVVAAITNAVDIKAMLRSAVQALGRLPGVLEASVHLDASGGAAMPRNAREVGGIKPADPSTALSPDLLPDPFAEDRRGDGNA